MEMFRFIILVGVFWMRAVGLGRRVTCSTQLLAAIHFVEYCYLEKKS